MRRLTKAVALAAVTWAGASAAEEPASSLLEAPAPLAAAIRSRFGSGVRILRLGVRAEGAEVEVQDAAVPSHVDRYSFESGVLGPPEPVQVGRSQKKLNARLFAFADVDLNVLPSLLADARTRARTEEAAVTQVSIERAESTGDVESWGRPRIRVHVEGPRGGALVEYGLDGKHRGVTRW